MAGGLRWVAAAVILTAGLPSVCEAASPARPRPEGGIALQTIVDMESTARLLAIMLDSGRSVINENQALFDNPKLSEKGFTPEVFEKQLAAMFRVRAGLDLADLDASHVPVSAKKWLKELVLVSKQVVKESQPDINQLAVQSKLIPAVFGARVASRFSERTGVRMKQTTLAPRNPANAPDPIERSALELFAATDYPREKVISEVTATSGTLRLMFPLYMTRQCLDCHGEPKGTTDKTGYPREGQRLGDNAGAISVIIPISQ